MDVLSIGLPQPQRPLGSIPFHEWVFPDGTRWAQFHRTTDGYLLRFPAIADFAITGDEQVVSCRPEPGVGAQTIDHLYLNQVLPLVLSHRGKLVFHGSAVELSASAVLFMGESGRGKSTLAASFAWNHVRFLADDGIAMEESHAGIRVEPSHPSIRLWADSEAALLGSEIEARMGRQSKDRARFMIADAAQHCTETLPLGRIYFLGGETRADVEIVPLAPAEALIELVKHSFLLDIEAAQLLASHFDRLSRLVQGCGCYRLEYPRRFESLADVRGAIMKHCG